MTMQHHEADAAKWRGVFTVGVLAARLWGGGDWWGDYNYDSSRIDRRSTPIRLQLFNRATTIRRPTLRPDWCTAT